MVIMGQQNIIKKINENTATICEKCRSIFTKKKMLTKNFKKSEKIIEIT
jgi:predicted nucleic acid-binding Zn ribbon protein